MALLRVNHAPGFSELFPHLRLSALTWNIFLLLAFSRASGSICYSSRRNFSGRDSFPRTAPGEQTFQPRPAAGFSSPSMPLASSHPGLRRADYTNLVRPLLLCLSGSRSLDAAPVSPVARARSESTGRHLLGSQAAPLDSTRPHITARFFWTTNAMRQPARSASHCSFSFDPTGRGWPVATFPWGKPANDGLSEQVDLGVMGPVKQDPSIVMRVELPDSPGTPAARGPLYLRGVAYNRYDGKSWSNNLLHRRMLTELPQGTFTPRTPGAKPPPQARALRQDILLEPLDTAVLFGAPLPSPSRATSTRAQSDLMGSLHLAISFS